MDKTPQPNKKKNRGRSAQNGQPQTKPGPLQPQASNSQKSVVRPQIKSNNNGIQGTKSNRTNEQTSKLPDQSQNISASLEVQQVTDGINNITMHNVSGPELVPVGRGVVRGRREIEHINLMRPESSLKCKEGTSGTSIAMVTNYFPITSYTNWTLYLYRVDFNPENENIGLKKKLINMHRAKLNPFVFDGTVLYSSIKHDSDKFELVSKCSLDDKIVIITVSFIRPIENTDHVNIQIFNLLIRNCLRHLDLKLIGRNFYDPVAKIDINKHQLQIWPGYDTTIGMFDKGLMMRTEISTKIMRQETVSQYYKNCMKNQDGLTMFKQNIIGAIVLTSYNNQTYRVHDIEEDTRANSTFVMKDKSKISFTKYYKEKWNLTVMEPDIPMLISKQKRSFANTDEERLIYLMPEFCSLTGLSDSMKNNFILMRDLAKFTLVDPKDRIIRYNNFMKRLQTTPKCLDIFDTWNLKLGQSLVELSGRTLEPENIQPNMSCKKIYNGGPSADWTNHLRDLPMFTCALVKQWFLFYPPNMTESVVNNFVTNLQQVSNKMNFMLPQPNLVKVNDNQLNTYLRQLDAVCNRFNPSLILCVLGNTRADFYSAVKKTLCVNRAVPSQVVVAKNIEKNNKSVCTKIAVQMNAKLGGAPWFVSIPVKGMMIVGFDVCHIKHKNISYGALIATTNDTHTSFYSAVQRHSSGDELSNHIGALIVAATSTYLNKNKALPSSIVIYRDGVGDGMLHHVQRTEVESIKRLYKEAFKQKPAMAFIVVKKRISTRFFAKSTQGFSNPPPGTIIDKIVTDPLMYDFFLISQNTRFGTVTPTHYNVIEDTLKNWSPDRMQRLTFKLTHMYFNWSGTVRVPAPCQLAHKLAYLAAQIGVPNNGLNELLYYL